MIYTVGIDVGSTYTKALILGDDYEIAGKAMLNTGFKLEQAAQRALDMALETSNLHQNDVDYIVATGFGRHQVSFRDVNATDLTASAHGASFLYPGTRTILDVGGQTMKAMRVGENRMVKSFRLNDKCAAGTGAFLEKTARYMGYSTEEIGVLALTSKEMIPVSGVCAVFAESEVINHLSLGASPADIMYGSIHSLVKRSVQLLKRVRMEPEFTLIGGILRFETMANILRDELKTDVNVPAGDLVQFTTALGAAVLGHRRLQKLQEEPAVVANG